jgi:ATP-dependent Clp protease ATP-binding subunit ClpB
VGKTELARALAWFLFDDQDAMIRMDMSEYMEKHEVSRLVGAPPGYIGYEEGGQLTEKVRRRPYSVVLFDEIEKAHPDVFNILLQVFDDGRLTDGHGRTIDFTNTVIIMTSNIATEEITELENEENKGPAGADQEDNLKETVHNALKRRFRPEFLNRIDEIITFNKLSMENIKDIVNIQLGLLKERLKDKKITLAASDAAITAIAEKGYDEVYGARPLKRVIQGEVENEFARMILEGKLPPGSRIQMDVKDGYLTYKIK